MANKEPLSRLGELSRSRKKAHALFLKSRSPVYKKFLELEEAAYAPRTLDRKTKLLIGAAVSVVVNCEACMQWHVEEAAAAGASAAEMMEAVEVAIKMGGAPAVVASRLALEAMSGLFKL